MLLSCLHMRGACLMYESRENKTLSHASEAWQ